MMVSAPAPQVTVSSPGAPTTSVAVGPQVRASGPGVPRRSVSGSSTRTAYGPTPEATVTVSATWPLAVRALITPGAALFPCTVPSTAPVRTSTREASSSMPCWGVMARCSSAPGWVAYVHTARPPADAWALVEMAFSSGPPGAAPFGSSWLTAPALPTSWTNETWEAAESITEYTPPVARMAGT